MRLIDADALIKSYDLHIVIGAGDNICIDIADIAKAPTVDAVPVVRCKDCKYWVEEKELGMFCGCWGGMLTSCKQDDFCSYGERKDNEPDQCYDYDKDAE